MDGGGQPQTDDIWKMRNMSDTREDVFSVVAMHGDGEKENDDEKKNWSFFDTFGQSWFKYIKAHNL